MEYGISHPFQHWTWQIALVQKVYVVKNCHFYFTEFTKYRSSRQEVFLRKDVVKICSKFTGEHSCRSAISIKLQSMSVLLYMCYIFSEHLFPKSTSGRTSANRTLDNQMLIMRNAMLQITWQNNHIYGSNTW